MNKDDERFGSIIVGILLIIWIIGSIISGRLIVPY